MKVPFDIHFYSVKKYVCLWITFPVKGKMAPLFVVLAPTRTDAGTNTRQTPLAPH